MLILCYPRCSTCQKALKWLDLHGIAYDSRNIQTEPPTVGELDRWQTQSGLPLKRFFNTSGLRYKALNLKDSLPSMPRSEQLALLASDGMLVKRPLLMDGETVLVGFREAEWEAALL